MREEMVGVIEKLADTHGVAIAGSRWEDYVAALRGVTDPRGKSSIRSCGD
jgi:hypothetical protein